MLFEHYPPMALQSFCQRVQACYKVCQLQQRQVSYLCRFCMLIPHHFLQFQQSQHMELDSCPVLDIVQALLCQLYLRQHQAWSFSGSSSLGLLFPRLIILNLLLTFYPKCTTSVQMCPHVTSHSFRAQRSMLSVGTTN